MRILFIIYFLYAVVISIDIDYKILVNFFTDIVLNLLSSQWLEIQLLPIFSQNLVNNIWDNLRKMHVDQSRRRQPNIIIWVSSLELNLMMIQQFQWLIFSTHINNDITGIPDFRITASDYLCTFEFCYEIC